MPVHPGHASLSPARATGLVLMLMLALALSFLDRQVLALLVDPIKADLEISDTEFGVLQGAAFAIFYIGFGIPLGRLADRSSRRNIIIAGIALWSIATAACGTATSFVALFAWRAMVGVGEAALSPAAYSMIADAVPKRRLTLALAGYSLGVYVGSGLALLVGGLLLAWLGGADALPALLPSSTAHWRWVFLLIGIPGLIMTAMLLLVKEPPRRQLGNESASDIPSIGEVARFVWRERRLFGGLILGFALHNTALYALLAWMPAFTGRHYGLAPSEFSTTLGLATIAGGIIGLILGGLVSDALLARGVKDAPIRVGVTSMAGMAIFANLSIHGGTVPLTAWLFGVTIFFVALPIGTAAAALQLVVPNRYRGQISALYLTMISVVGLNVGPMLPPLLGDHLFHDPARIGDALGWTLAGAAILSVLCFLAGRAAYARRYAAIHPDQHAFSEVDR